MYCIVFACVIYLCLKAFGEKREKLTLGKISLSTMCFGLLRFAPMTAQPQCTSMWLETGLDFDYMPTVSMERILSSKLLKRGGSVIPNTKVMGQLY